MASELHTVCFPRRGYREKLVVGCKLCFAAKPGRVNHMPL